MLERREGREFYCVEHHALFLPARFKGSALWARVQEGLRLFGVAPQNLSAVTGFRLDMAHRSPIHRPVAPEDTDDAGDVRVPARRHGKCDPLLAGARAQQRAGIGNVAGPVPGGGLRGDLARRGLPPPRSGHVDAPVPAQKPGLATDGDDRHGGEPTDDQGPDRAGDCRRGARRDDRKPTSCADKAAGRIRRRLGRASTACRMRYPVGHLDQLPGQILHTLPVSEAWDTSNVGGEEVDVGWLLDAPARPEMA